MKEQKLQRWDPFAPTFWESPFSVLRRMTSDMERFFEEFPAGRRLPRGHSLREAQWIPNIDVFEKDGNLVIRADLPGLTKEDVNVEVTDEAIALQGERKKEIEEEREGLYRLERAYGSFYRSVPLPSGVNADDVKATFKNGVLEINAPLPPAKKAAKARRLELEEATK